MTKTHLTKEPMMEEANEFLSVDDKLVLGVCELFVEDGTYKVVNTKTGVTVVEDSHLINAMFKAQDEANAYSSAVETRKKQDLESKTGLIIPDKDILLPGGR